MVRSQMLHPSWLGIDLLTLLLTTGSAGTFYGVAMVAGVGGLRYRWWEIPAVLALGIGLTASQTLAVIDGLFSTDATFVRTPKHGGQSRPLLATTEGRPFTLGICTLMTLYYAVAIAWACSAGLWLSVPFLCLFGSGYAIISTMLIQETRWGRTGEAAEMGPVPAAK
jgi:hypothetical protein